MSEEILHSFRVKANLDTPGRVGVPQQMRVNIEVKNCCTRTTRCTILALRRYSAESLNFLIKRVSEVTAFYVEDISGVFSG